MLSIAEQTMRPASDEHFPEILLNTVLSNCSGRCMLQNISNPDQQTTLNSRMLTIKYSYI
jgi:hypothetical protein